MPNFRTEVPHQLGKDAATERMSEFLDRVSRHYQDHVGDLKGEWNENVLDFAFTISGFKIGGTLTVEEEVVVLEGQLPFAAVPFRGKIEGGIAEELRKALAHS